MKTRDLLTFAEQYNLTPRETEVLQTLGIHGYTNEDLAKRIWIKPKTVTLHVTNILNKTNSSSTRELLSKIIVYLLHQNSTMLNMLERGDKQINETRT